MTTPTMTRALRVKRAIIVALKRFVMFMFSHVGLTSAVVAYSILGGFIFKGLEAPYEKEIRDKIANVREEYTKRIVALSQQLENSTESYERWTRDAGKLVEEFQGRVYNLTSEDGWDGEDIGEELQWSFPGALLYSVTVITTIGYGNLAPRTNWGRVVTVMYAIVGIPLTFLCLRNIGSLLSSVVKLVYQHACIGLMRRWIILKAGMRKSRKIKRIRAAAVRARKWSREMNKLHVLHGDPLKHGVRVIEHEAVRVKPQHEVENDGHHLDNNHSDAKQDENITSGEEQSSDDETELSPLDDNSSPALKESPDVRIPVSLTLFLMTGYIIGGATMFSLWEKDWNYLIASYFCFISLSTIGFGDFVPGMTSDTLSSQEKRVICYMYLLFGMAMQAMCFHLMQEEVRYKFRKLARKIGLLEEEQPKVRKDDLQDEEEEQAEVTKISLIEEDGETRHRE